MITIKTENGYEIDLDELSYSNDDLTVDSLHDEIERLTHPKLSDCIEKYADPLGIKSVMESINKINDLTGVSNIQSLIDQSSFGDITDIYSYNTDLLGSISTVLFDQQNHMQRLTDEYTLSGLEQSSALSDAFMKTNCLSNENLSNYHASLLKNAFSSPVYDDVSLLNNRLAGLTLAKEVNQFDSVSKLVDSYMLGETSRLTSSFESIYKDNLSDLLKQEQVKLSDIYSDLTLQSAADEVCRLAGLPDSSVMSLLNSIPDSFLNNTLDSSVLGLAGIKSKQLSKMLDGSFYHGVAELDELIRQSTLSAFEVFESFCNDTNDEFTASDESLREIRESLSEIKESLNQSSQTANIKDSVSFLIAILSILYAIHASNDTENKTKHRHKELKGSIEAIETTMVTQYFFLSHQLDNIDERLQKTEQPNQPDIVEYAVVRPVNLRTQSNTSKDSHIITTLQPNLKVELLKRNGKWIYVGYFDYVEDLPKTGWVAKKYLKMIKKPD